MSWHLKLIKTVYVSSNCELSSHNARILHGGQLPEDFTNHRTVKIGELALTRGWALAWGKRNSPLDCMGNGLVLFPGSPLALRKNKNRGGEPAIKSHLISWQYDVTAIIAKLMTHCVAT